MKLETQPIDLFNLIYSVKSLYRKDGQGLRLKFWAQGVLGCLLNSPIGLKRWSSPKGWALLKESPGLVAVWRRSLCEQVEKGAPGALPGQSRARARHVHWLSTLLNIIIILVIGIMVMGMGCGSCTHFLYRVKKGEPGGYLRSKRGHHSGIPTAFD